MTENVCLPLKLGTRGHASVSCALHQNEVTLRGNHRGRKYLSPIEDTVVIRTSSPKDIYLGPYESFRECAQMKQIEYIKHLNTFAPLRNFFLFFF